MSPRWPWKKLRSKMRFNYGCLFYFFPTKTFLCWFRLLLRGGNGLLLCGADSANQQNHYGRCCGSRYFFLSRMVRNCMFVLGVSGILFRQYDRLEKEIISVVLFFFNLPCSSSLAFSPRKWNVVSKPNSAEKLHKYSCMIFRIGAYSQMLL